MVCSFYQMCLASDKTLVILNTKQKSSYFIKQKRIISSLLQSEYGYMLFNNQKIKQILEHLGQRRIYPM